VSRHLLAFHDKAVVLKKKKLISGKKPRGGVTNDDVSGREREGGREEIHKKLKF
jgi:hypothetical protein